MMIKLYQIAIDYSYSLMWINFLSSTMSVKISRAWMAIVRIPYAIYSDPVRTECNESPILTW